MPKVNRRDFISKSAKKTSRARKGGVTLGRLIIGLVFVIAVVSIFAVQRSEIYGNRARYSIVWMSSAGDVKLLSFSPVEKVVNVFEYPSELEIKSRSVGTYKIGSLHRLGEYEGRAGDFTRRKIQGFMKLPTLSYIVSDQVDGKSVFVRTVLMGSVVDTNIKMIDRVILAYQALSYRFEVFDTEEMLKRQLIEDKGGYYLANSRRISDLVRQDIVDWAVGEENVSVAVVNESNEEGLASDVGELVQNIGINLVNVRAGSEKRESTTFLISREDIIQTHTYKVLSNTLGVSSYEVVDTDLYRADLVIKVSDDMKAIF